MDEQGEPPRKLSRQERWAQARQKHDAAGWIAALASEDLPPQPTIQAAIGQRQVTRAEGHPVPAGARDRDRAAARAARPG